MLDGKEPCDHGGALTHERELERHLDKFICQAYSHGTGYCDSCGKDLEEDNCGIYCYECEKNQKNGE